MAKMVIINNKTAMTTFVLGTPLIPGAHPYQFSDEELEQVKANEIVAHHMENDKFEIVVPSDGIPTYEDMKTIVETASAKELDNLIAKVEKARKASVALAEKAAEEQDETKKAAAAEKAQKASDALKIAEKALEERRVALEAKRAQENQ